MATEKECEVKEVGFSVPPSQLETDVLRAGDVGFMSASIRNINHAKVGDTIIRASKPGTENHLSALPGYSPPRQMVFCGVYPTESDQFDLLKDSIEKLKLNDAAISFTPESSDAFGAGFRCGFLGLLHVRVFLY
jgi:GTP-binding protein LepA